MRLRIRKNLSISLKDNSSAYGYSITISGAYAILELSQKSPANLLEIFAGASGAVLAFIAVETALSLLGRDLDDRDTELTRVIARMLAFASIGSGMGTAAFCGWVLHGAVAWFAGGFLATSMFVVIDAFELALVEQESPSQD